MRILLTNDDGINAEGLKVLERIARTLSNEVWVAAPETEQSGTSHSLTLHVPVRVRQIGEKRFAISGTPTDCVLLGMREIIPSSSPLEGEGREGGSAANSTREFVASAPPPNPLPQGEGEYKIDLVLSGINCGSNVGDDITYSGTVAGAMEGVMLGVPSIALSQLCGGSETIHWQTAERFAPELIQKLLKAGWPSNSFLNINFPDCAPDDVKGIKLCPQGKRRVNVQLTGRIDPKGRPYYWIGGERNNESDLPGSDIDLLHQNYITVTPLCMDLTDAKTMEKWAALNLF